MSADQWEALRERLTKATEELEELADDSNPSAEKSMSAAMERFRLKGKSQGVKLALSYMDDHDRGVQ
jgi:hypothetical protein